MEIKIIPYEDKEKYASFLLSALTKEFMIYQTCHINSSFENISRLVELLKDFDLEKYTNREITIIFGNSYFEPI